jgi:holo-[acyl-carrier protein] synthase
MVRLTNGVDLVDIQRLQETIERHGQRFLTRVYTPLELAEAGHNPASLAARFAAKEAVAKALGCGIGVITWREIEIRRGPERRPELILHGAAAVMAQEQGWVQWSISLSHTHTMAAAFVVAASE